MKKLIIIGARGFGREISILATNTKEYGQEYELAGFLDDKSDALDGFDGYPPIISTVEDYQPQPDDVFICALGESNARQKYAQIIEDKGGKFINLISPAACISRNTKLGKGCMIMRNASISCDIHIGDHCIIMPFANLGHDVIVGDYCNILSMAFLGGYVQLGNACTLNTGCIINPKKKIGDNATIGAGAFVIRNVKEGSVMYGNPAKRLPQ